MTESQGERLAVLESQMRNLQEQHTEVMGKLESLLTAINRYKGFVGGMMFTLTAIGGVLGWLVNYWFQKPTG